MLKKAFKGQVIKNIKISGDNTSGPFVRDDIFYLPVEIDSFVAKFFNVVNLNVIFTPKKFVSSLRQEDEALREDVFENISQQQPLHVKTTALNKTILVDNDIDPSSSNNSLFKSLYAKNLVSSKGQENFLENLTPVILEDSIKSKNTEIMTTTNVSDINLQGDRHNIKIVALNDRNEVVDSVTIDSGVFNQYFNFNNEENRNRTISLLRSDLSTFTNTVELNISPYVFPISRFIESYNVIRGSSIDYETRLLKNIFDSYGTNALINVNASATSEEIEESLQLFSFSYIDFNEILNQNLENTNIQLINSQDYFQFINSAYRYCIENNLDKFDFEYNINLTCNFIDQNIEGYNIVLEKRSSLSLELLSIAYNDLFRFRFEKDLIERRVIIPSLEKIDRDSDLSFEKHKLTILLNSDDYNIEDIVQNCVSFRFVDSNGDDVIIEDFYLDTNLSNSNFIKVDTSTPMLNYFASSRRISLYFTRSSTSSSIEFMFMRVNKPREAQSTFEVGPFFVSLIQGSINLINQSIYQNCSNLLSSLITKKSNISDIDYIKRSLGVEGFSSIENYNFSLQQINNNQNFKNLGYYSSSDENLTPEEKINNILNNVALKIRKKLFINNTLVGEISSIKMLNDPSLGLQNTSSLNRELNVNRILTSNFTDLNFENRLIASDYESFKQNNIERLSDNFQISYALGFKFLVFENNTVEKFGRTTDFDQSRINLIDQISTYNPVFQVEVLNNLIDDIYSEDYSLNQTDLLQQLYNLMNLNNFYDKEIIFNLSKSSLQTEFVQNNNQILNRFLDVSRENIENFAYTNNIACDVNLGYYLKQNSVVIEKINARKNIFIKMYGQEIDLLVSLYKSTNSSTITKSYASFNIEFSSEDYTVSSNTRETLVDRLNNKFYFKLPALEERRLNRIPVEVEIGDNISIVFSEEEYFKKYTDSFYNEVLNSIQHKSNTLKGKVVIKFVVILLINGSKYTISKNVYLEPLREKMNQENSAVGEDNKLNFLKEEFNVFMPSILCKGTF